MAISDTEVRYWSTTPASNRPTGGSFINRDLPKQWRNIKSNVRGESLDKEFEKRQEVPLNVTHSGGGLAAMSFSGSDGDLTGVFTVMRKVRFTPVDGGEPIYCAVLTSSHSGSTSVVLAELTDALASGGEYLLDVGVENPELPSLPGFVQSGSITISGASTSGVATFGRNEATDDLDYFARATVLSVVGTPNGPQALVVAIDKAAGSMTIHLAGAPGVGNQTVVGWTILRET